MVGAAVCYGAPCSGHAFHINISPPSAVELDDTIMNAQLLDAWEENVEG